MCVQKKLQVTGGLDEEPGVAGAKIAPAKQNQNAERQSHIEWVLSCQGAWSARGAAGTRVVRRTIASGAPPLSSTR